MSDLNAKRIRDDALRITGVDMPISGGTGNSREDPIVIDDTDPAKSSYWEWRVVGFISQMRGDTVELEKATVLDIEDKKIEKFQISRVGDDGNFYNYYFDVTASLGGKDKLPQ